MNTMQYLLHYNSLSPFPSSSPPPQKKMVINDNNNNKVGNSLRITFIQFLNVHLKRAHLEKNFHHIYNLRQNIKFTMEEESNGELVFLHNLLK